MSKRRRLTARTLLAETRADGLFPGDVGNKERDKHYYDVDHWNNEASEFKDGWDLTDKTDTWSASNERGPANIGIMKTASRYRTAKQAIAMAEMFLGKNASESQIKAQAKEFLPLGYRTICASIRRFATANEEEAEEQKAPAAGELKTSAVEAPKTEELKASATEAPKAEEPKVPAAEAPKTEEPADDVDELTDEPVTEGGEAPEMVIDIPEQQDEGITDLGDGQLTDVEADPELEALFNDDGDEEKEEKTEAPAKVEASKKAGVKKLAGGQPKLASTRTSGVQELQGLWNGLKIPGL